jgi:hypothetical protein
MNGARIPRRDGDGNDESLVLPVSRSSRILQPEVSLQNHSGPSGVEEWINEISRARKGGPENTHQLARLLHRARRSIGRDAVSPISNDSVTIPKP